MSVLPQKLRKEMNEDPEYQICALKGHLVDLIGPCDGRVTREHAIYYANKKVQERWAVPPICAKHHGVDLWLDAGTAPKLARVWVALNRATDDELMSVSKVVNYARERMRLNQKYGPWKSPVPVEKDVDNPVNSRV